VQREEGGETEGRRVRDREAEQRELERDDRDDEIAVAEAQQPPALAQPDARRP
jgi:hypothetical protein